MSTPFGRDASPVRSEMGEDSPKLGKSTGDGGARVRREQVGKVLAGRGPRKHDPRKHRYDVTRGAANKLPFEVTKEDRLSAEEAGAEMVKLHKLVGIDREDESILYAFDSALFFMHTVNGGSVLGPGRGAFKVPGMTESFSYGMVRDALGINMRRFFRAFADDTTEVNKRVLDQYDPLDPVKEEQWAWLIQVAAERGLQRFPYLAHDSADACMRLSVAERAALSQSKAVVIGSVYNAADRLMANPRVPSKEGYDSTTGTQPGVVA